MNEFVLDDDFETNRLQDITQQESGIIQYTNGDIIVTNWSGAECTGLPGMMLTISQPFYMSKENLCVTHAQHIEDIKEYLDDGFTILCDPNQDIAYIFEHTTPADLYELEDGTKIFAPEGWN